MTSKHKSEDYKKSAVEYYLVGDKSQLEVCEIFKCSARSLMRWVDKYEKEGEIKRQKRKPVAYKVRKEHVKFLLYEITKNKTITMSELMLKLKEKFNGVNDNPPYHYYTHEEIIKTLKEDIKEQYDKEGKITEKYKKFNGKKIITCIFSLDANEPYYIDWNDAIKNNCEIIKNRIYFNIIEKYKLETSNLYYFYKYYRLFCPENEKSPSDFIRFVKEKYDEIKKQMIFSINFPKYVDEFFSEIEFEIQRSKGKTNKELILKKYDDNEYYSEKLEEILDINVKRYLGIKIDDDTDNDNDNNE
jgi:transposase